MYWLFIKLFGTNLKFKFSLWRCFSLIWGHLRLWWQVCDVFNNLEWLNFLLWLTMWVSNCCIPWLKGLFKKLSCFKFLILHTNPIVEFLENKDIWIPYWHEFNTKDGFNVVNPYSFDEYITLLASKKKLIFISINCFNPHFMDNMICDATCKVKSFSWWETKNMHTSCVLWNFNLNIMMNR